MKILITSPSLDENENVSGISTLVREIITHGKSDFSHFTAGRRDGERAGIGWIFRQIILPLRFLQKIRREKPDVVHVNTAFVPLSILRDAALISVAKRASTAVLLHPNGGRFLIEDFKNEWLESVAVKMLRRADKILVLSEFEKESLTRRWQNLNIGILPNAISTKQIPQIEKNSGKKTIIFFGRIHESKGLHEIIEACRILKNENADFNFRCFGTGPEKDFFVEEMSKILGEKFFYGGVIAGKDKWRELAEADIFLLPSRYGEGLPLALLEAMAARCVPVVGNVASVRAVIEEGKNGFMVEPYNALQTAEKLKFLLSDKTDWQTLRENAQQTVEEKFSIEDYVENLERIYEETKNLAKS